VLVRPVRPEDGEAIRRIYNVEVASSSVTFDIEPWGPVDQQRWFERHQGVYPAVVGVTGQSGAGATTTSELSPPTGEVAGFGALSRYRARPAYATTVEDSVYVDRRHRRIGAGRAILDELVRLAAEHGFHTVIARVVGHNEASIELHRACGFHLVGVEREVGRKHGRWLDVVELQRIL
jgi:L-amino acid N-acyltransferase